MLVQLPWLQHYVRQPCAARLLRSRRLVNATSGSEIVLSTHARAFAVTPTLLERRRRSSSRSGKVFSPNALLLEALSARGAQLPVFVSNKTDHTFVTPFDLFLKRLSNGPEQVFETSEDVVSREGPVSSLDGTSSDSRNDRPYGYSELETADNQNKPNTQHSGLSLKLVLANFVNSHFDSDLQKALRENPELVISQSKRYFDTKSVKYLQFKGYSTEDMILWLWILTAGDAFVSAARLLAAGNRASTGSNAGVPPFILMTLLRRTDLNATALKLIWIQATSLFQRRHRPDWPSLLPKDVYKQVEWCHQLMDTTSRAESLSHKIWPVLSLRTAALMIIRLMRHARKVWPELLPSLAQTFERHVLGDSASKVRRSPRGVLSFILNKLLGLFAIPSTRMSSNIRYHQRAMHRIVSAMMTLDPPISISREGHRSIIRLQLANRTTPEEEEWARLKALSWPPWPRPRLGIEDDMSTEKGVSRAGRALEHLQTAGYEIRNWDETAKVLSGWDTDNSPTIQSRSVLRSPPTFSDEAPHSRTSSPVRRIDSLLWSAKVRATRTAEEAWKVFLDFRDAHRLPIHEVYLEMFKKLLAHEKKQLVPAEQVISSSSLRGTDKTTYLVPGISSRVTASPKDPHLWPYLRAPLPSVEAFFNQAILDSLRVERPLLVLLLNHESSYDFGRKVLENSVMEPDVVRNLLDLQHPRLEMLAQVEDPVFAAVVNWLSSQSSFRDPYLIVTVKSHSWLEFGPVRGSHKNALVVHALRLVCMSGRPYGPAWLILLDNLARGALLWAGRRKRRSVEELWTIFNKVLAVLERTDPYATYFFPQLCRMFSTVAASSALGSVNKEKSPYDFSTSKLKVAFESFTGSHLRVQDALNQLQTKLTNKKSRRRQDTSLDWPALHVPDEPTLHWFAVALALMGDRDGLVQLVLWLWQHHEEVNKHRKLGAPLHCFLAIRLGLEWQQSAEDKKRLDSNAVQIIRSAAEDIEGRGAWPSDAELDHYLARRAQSQLFWSWARASKANESSD